MKKIGLLIAATLLFIGCSEQNSDAPKSTQSKQIPPLPVKSHSVKLQSIEFSKKYPAVLKPFKEVVITARISGFLIKENFKEGDEVKKGDTLYEIQKDEYAAALKEAEATFEKASVNLDKTTKDWNRAAYLFKNAAISEEQKDQYQYAYNDAKAELNRAKAALENSRIEYGYTTIKAPISGIIGLSSSDEGAYINIENDSAKLATITSWNPIYAEFSIPGHDIQNINGIKKGLKAILHNNKRSYNGKVDFISPKLDIQTDTLLLRAVFENSDKSLLAGAYAEISLEGFGYDNVAKIPQNALIKTPQATMVYVIKEDKGLTMKPVEVVNTENGFAFISKGLKENEKVVISNIAKIRPHTKVTILGGE